MPGSVDCSVQQVRLDFHGACTGGRVFQNLGGLGPDSGPEEVRYRQIATHNGVDVDLVITLAAGQPWMPKQLETRIDECLANGQLADANGVMSACSANSAWTAPGSSVPKPAGDSSGCVPDGFRGRLQFENGQRNTFNFQIQRCPRRGLPQLSHLQLET